MPQSAQDWPRTNDMKFPNEIDEQLIRLGHSVDGAFQQGLADSFDVLGNLDRDPNLNIDGVRDVLNSNSPTPWLPVRIAQGRPKHPHIINIGGDNIVEFLRPWAYPDKNNDREPDKKGNFLEGPLIIAGPYARSTMPHDLFTSPRAVSNLARTKYQQAGCPDDTLKYSMAYIRHESSHLSEDGWEGTNPLGDPVPFSAYLIGQIACNPNFVDPKNGKGSNFNLDADRGYGYLCWDWTRLAASEPKTHQDRRDHFFPDPISWPEGSLADKDAKKWVEDTASGVGAKLHSQKVNGKGSVVQYDMKVNYFGRDGCKETDEGGGEQEPPSIIK